MIRQCMEAGTRQFGMCIADGESEYVWTFLYFLYSASFCFSYTMGFQLYLFLAFLIFMEVMF